MILGISQYTFMHSTNNHFGCQSLLNKEIAKPKNRYKYAIDPEKQVSN
jgi:hypothetical protein